jgi:hypothetical protein
MEPRISPIPPGESAPLFKHARISVVRIDPDDFIPDYGPPLLDRALMMVNGAMPGRFKDKRDLDDVRASLDWPPKRQRRELGMLLENIEPSDIGIAAILLNPESPFGIMYEWAPGAVKLWPEGLALVWYRGHVYEVPS